MFLCVSDVWKIYLFINTYQSLRGHIVFHLQKWNEGKKEMQLGLLLGVQFKKIGK